MKSNTFLYPTKRLYKILSQRTYLRFRPTPLQLSLIGPAQSYIAGITPSLQPRAATGSTGFSTGLGQAAQPEMYFTTVLINTSSDMSFIILPRVTRFKGCEGQTATAWKYQTSQILDHGSNVPWGPKYPVVS